VNRPFADVYRGTRVLVTGHTGFKGSWLVAWLERMGASVAGLALDPEGNPSHWALLDSTGVVDRRGDVLDRATVDALVDAHRPRIVFHLAAQSLVRRGYRQPAATFAVNVQGVVNVLEACRQSPSVQAVVVATTDKVYDDLPERLPYDETCPLGHHDPYSASKACAELVAGCYAGAMARTGARAGDMRVATVRSGNVIGGGDWSEDRLVPDLARATACGTATTIRHPAAIRPWQHVLDSLSGYLRLGQRLLDGSVAGGAWNVGPDVHDVLSVEAFIAAFGETWPVRSIVSAPAAQVPEVDTLRLDIAKARRGLGWEPVWSARESIARTAAWYRDYYADGNIGTLRDLEAYLACARERGRAWT